MARAARSAPGLGASGSSAAAGSAPPSERGRQMMSSAPAGFPFASPFASRFANPLELGPLAAPGAELAAAEASKKKKKAKKEEAKQKSGGDTKQLFPKFPCDIYALCWCCVIRILVTLGITNDRGKHGQGQGSEIWQARKRAKRGRRGSGRKGEGQGENVNFQRKLLESGVEHHWFQIKGVQLRIHAAFLGLTSSPPFLGGVNNPAYWRIVCVS